MCESFKRLILAEKVGEIKAALDDVSQHIVRGKISLWDIIRITIGRLMMKDRMAKTLSEVLKEKFRMLPHSASDLHVRILETGQRLDSIISNGRSEMLSALRRRRGSTDADAQELDNLITENQYNGYPMSTVPCNTCGAAVVEYYDWRYQKVHRETNKACAEIVSARKKVLAEQQKELAECVRKRVKQLIMACNKADSTKPPYSQAGFEEIQKELAECVRKQLLKQLSNYCNISLGKPKMLAKVARM